MTQLKPEAVFHGPNPLAREPVLVVDLVLSDDDARRLLQVMPTLEAQCADWYRPRQAQRGAEGAGVSRAEPDPAVQVGQFLADWALQALTWVRGYLHVAGCVRDAGDGKVLVWLAFHDARLALAALRLGARWLDGLARGAATGEDGRAALERLWMDCRQQHPDYQARIVMEAARRRGIPYAPAWGLARHWRYGQGERSRVLFESSSCAEGHFGSRLAGSKSMSKAALRALGLPTPAFALVNDEGELEAAVAVVGWPCVTKPLDRGGGKGVSAGLRDLSAVRDGYAAARAVSSGPVMVEAHVAGEDHRLLVVDSRLVAAIRREPPSITGDGRQTIRELLAAKNQGRDARDLAGSGYLRPIRLDASAHLHLAGLGLGPETVLAQGQTVRVRSNANLSTGGVCVDVTARVHPQLRALAESLAHTLNLPMLGVDYLTSDISANPAAGGGQFIEINTTPGLDALVAAGWSSEQAGALALGLLPARISVTLLLVRHEELPMALDAARAHAWVGGSGWACWDAAAIAGAQLCVDTHTPWAGVQALLSHRTVGQAVVVASERQMYRHGLPLDAFDAAHLGCEAAPEWLCVLQRHCGAVRQHDPRREERLSWLHQQLESLA